MLKIYCHTKFPVFVSYRHQNENYLQIHTGAMLFHTYLFTGI
jgi:hypothetical protein